MVYLVKDVAAPEMTDWFAELMSDGGTIEQPLPEDATPDMAQFDVQKDVADTGNGTLKRD